MIQKSTAQTRSLRFTWADDTALFKFGTTGKINKALLQQYLEELQQVPSKLSPKNKKQVQELEQYFKENCAEPVKFYTGIIHQAEL